LEARLKSGLTQKEFARRLGVTAHTVANWEAGRTAQIRLLNLRALAQLTSKPVSWFLKEGE
jgi:transcriptional regulator with XRE-family HTH domain